MLNKQEKKEVADSLKGLFVLKGIYHTDEMVKVLTEYFANSKYYLSSILKGIKRLESEVLDSVTNTRIEDSIKATLSHSVGKMYPNCIYCEDMGLISMVDSQGNGTSLACKCDRGNGVRNSGQVTWNGEVSQVSNGRELRLANVGKLMPIDYNPPTQESYDKFNRLARSTESTPDKTLILNNRCRH